MCCDDLRAAAKAARYLASTAATIRALREEGQSAVATKLLDELNHRYSEARAAIGSVRMELRRSRDSAARLSGVVAPTAHEAAIEMVFALNREWFGVEVVGRMRTQVWPDADEVMAEIEIEYTKALDRRGQEESKRRLVVDLERREIIYDGEVFPCRSEQALRVLRVYAEHAEQWFTAKQVAAKDSEVSIDKVCALKGKLPAKVRRLIEGHTHNGSRLMLPPKGNARV